MCYEKSVDYEQIVRQMGWGYKAFKRLFDVVVSIFAMLILIVIVVPVSIAIMIEDGFPIFFVQKRTGLNGKVFRMYKFRSMCKNAQQMHFELLDKNELDGPAFKMKKDPRITKVGSFIRKTSIDELPQLLNILKGEMSFVGPRPLPTYEMDQCNEYQKQRLLVKPGLTCYWQCMGRNDIMFDEWMELDLKYIRDASILTDLKLIILTFRTVLFSKGAY